MKAFQTEAKYDKLIINGNAYSGNVGPSGIVPEGSISWSSDGSVSKTGFNLCPQEAMFKRGWAINDTLMAILQLSNGINRFL